MQSSGSYHLRLKECSELRDDRNYINRCECSEVNSEGTDHLIAHAIPFAAPRQLLRTRPHRIAKE